MSGGQTTRGRAWRLAGAVAGIVVLLALVASLTRAPLENWARRKILAELEQATGGRAEARSITWSLRRGEIELNEVTVHGREAAGAPPYLRAGRIFARLQRAGLLGGWSLGRLEIDRPQVHVLIFPDGSSNLPQPVLKESDSAQVQRLFTVQAGRVEARNGEFYWNDRRTPFDFSANDVQFRVDYEPRERRYDGALEAGRLQTSYKDLRPFASVARLEFSLWPSKLEVKSFSWSSNRSKVEASGVLEDFDRPRGELRYDGSLDLAQWASIARSGELQGGTLELHGSGTYRDGAISSAGKLQLRGAIYAAKDARLAIGSASGDYEVDAHTLKVTRLVLHTLGGTAEGSAKIANWTQFTPPAGAEGNAQLRLQGLSLAELLAASPPTKRRLGGMNLVGRADGNLALAWRGALRDAEAKVSLQIRPPVSDPPQDVPVTGRIDLDYSGKKGTRISVLDLKTANGTHLEARGAIGPKGGLQVSFTTQDLSPFEPLLTAMALGVGAPTAIRGGANFSGTFRGDLAAPAIAGRLELTDFDALMPPLRGEPAPRHPIHLDHFAADVEYSPASLAARHGSLRSGSIDARFDIAARLQRGSIAQGAPLQARIAFQHALLADVQRLLGTNYPVSGTAGATLNVSGPRDRLRGGGPVEVSNGAIYGQPFRSLAGGLQLEGGEVRLQNVRLAQDGGTVTGEVAYRAADGGLRFHLTGTGFALGKIPQLQWPRLKIEGTAAFHATGEGTIAQPVISAELALRNLVLNNERAGDFELQGTTRGAELQLNGSSRMGESRMTVRGGIHLGGDYPATIGLRFSGMDVDPLIEALTPAELTGHSAVTGTLDLSGPLRRPRELTARGDLEQFRAYLENLELGNQGPIKLSYSGQVVRLEQLHLVGEDTDLKADGTVSLSGDRPLDVRADGRMNLKLLESMNPAIAAYGRTVVAVSVSGTFDHPSVQGQVYIRDAGLSYTDLPNGLTNLNGTLIFNQNRLVVQTLRAQTGGGDLDLGGFIAYERRVYFNLTATGKGIRIRYPAGVSLQADATLRYTGTLANSLLAGEVLVDRFNVTPQFDLALYIAQSARPATAPSLSPALNNLKFDVHVTSAPELEVQTSTGFKVTGDADLRIRGTASRPTVLGRVNISEGEVKFNNATYQLDRGDITFTNPTLIEPVFNIDATTRVRDYDITLSFHGTPDQLQNPMGGKGVTFRSDPPLPTGDIMALLAMGRTREESPTFNSQSTTSSFTEAASNAILGAAISNVLSSRAQKLFGLSQIKIDPSVGGPDNNPNARLTIEQQVSGRVTLTYITNLAQSAQQVIQAEFQINRNLSIIAVRDQYGVVGFDVRYRHRRR